MEEVSLTVCDVATRYKLLIGNASYQLARGGWQSGKQEWSRQLQSELSTCRDRNMSRNGSLWIGGLEEYMDEDFIMKCLNAMGETYSGVISIKVTITSQF